MNAINQSHLSQEITLSISIENDEVLIVNASEIQLCNQALLRIAFVMLTKFKQQQPLECLVLQSFVDEVLKGIPLEGGAVPLENVVEWIELQSTVTRPRFIDYIETMSIEGKPQPSIA